MARAVLTPQAAPWNSVAEIVWTLATADGFTMVNNGQTEILLWEPQTGGTTVTVRSIPDALSRYGDVVTMPLPGRPFRAGPFPKEGYNQPADNRLLHIDIAPPGMSPPTLKVAATKRHPW